MLTHLDGCLKKLTMPADLTIPSACSAIQAVQLTLKPV